MAVISKSGMLCIPLLLIDFSTSQVRQADNYSTKTRFQHPWKLPTQQVLLKLPQAFLFSFNCLFFIAYLQLGNKLITSAQRVQKTELASLIFLDNIYIPIHTKMLNRPKLIILYFIVSFEEIFLFGCLTGAISASKIIPKMKRDRYAIKFTLTSDDIRITIKYTLTVTIVHTA